MRTLQLIFAMLLLVSGMAIAQKTDAVSAPGDKKKIALRPNSRDYGPVIRDNFHKKRDFHRDKTKFMKVRPAPHEKMIKPGKPLKNNAIKKDQMKRKRQMMQQRRTLRK